MHGLHVQSPNFGVFTHFSKKLTGITTKLQSQIKWNFFFEEAKLNGN